MAKKHNFQEGETCAQAIKMFGKDKLLTDKEEIAYYFNWVREIRIQNKLIGKIMSNGSYQISEKLRRELVKMEKEAVDLSRSYYIALSVYMKKTFNFAVEIDLLDDGRASASLYLNEVVQDVEGVSSLRTFIAKIIEPFDNHFESVVCTKFHIVETANSIQETDIPEITLELQDQLDDWLFMEEIDDIGSQIYVMRLLKELSSAGPIGQKIIAEYKTAILDKKNDEKAKGNNLKLRRLLDNIIEKNGGLEQLPVPIETLRQPMKEFNVTMQKVQDAKQSAAPAVTSELKGKIVGKAQSGASGNSGSAPKAAKKAKAAGNKAGAKSDKPKKAKSKKAAEDKPKKDKDKKKESAGGYRGGLGYDSKNTKTENAIEESPIDILPKSESKPKKLAEKTGTLRTMDVWGDLNKLREQEKKTNYFDIFKDLNNTRTQNAVENKGIQTESRDTKDNQKTKENFEME